MCDAYLPGAAVGLCAPGCQVAAGIDHATGGTAGYPERLYPVCRIAFANAAKIDAHAVAFQLYAVIVQESDMLETDALHRLVYCRLFRPGKVIIFEVEQLFQ